MKLVQTMKTLSFELLENQDTVIHANDIINNFLGKNLHGINHPMILSRKWGVRVMRYIVDKKRINAATLHDTFIKLLHPLGQESCAEARCLQLDTSQLNRISPAQSSTKAHERRPARPVYASRSHFPNREAGRHRS